jgi:methionyl aminopeptidase
VKRGPILKDEAQIALLRAAGRVARLALEAACEATRPGARTSEIDAVAEQVIRAHGATPEFKGYYDYPAATCISVNDEVVHGIPGDRVIGEGDLVSIDVGARLDGYVGDNAATVLVGEVSETARRLSDTTRECLERAIAQCRPGRRLSEVGRAIQAHAESRGFSIVRDYAGHGIGQRMHEDPQVLNYTDGAPQKTDLVLRPGLCIAIEPMVNAGGPDVRILEDRWTVVTSDGLLSAHWEDVVAVTEDGPKILTRP